MLDVKKELENQEKEIARLTRDNFLLTEENESLAKRLRRAYQKNTKQNAEKELQK